MKRMRHPCGIDILFDSKWHQYKLGHTALHSVSKLLDRYFPFDEKRILELVSRKTGEPVETIKRGWFRQALLGKNIHEYIECKLLGKPPPAFVLLLNSKRKREAARAAQNATGPSLAAADGGISTSIEAELLHGEEEKYMAVADKAVHTILDAYDILGVEQVIASPDWGIAGTIDFLGRNRKTNHILVGDWKTSGSVVSNFRFGTFESPCTGCLSHLPNSKAYRYSMQVIIYGEILRQQKYFESGFFDEVLRKSLQAAPSGSVRPLATPMKKGGVDPLVTDVAYYREDMNQKMEYGFVQLAKSDEGEVVVEYNAVTEQMVLLPDKHEITFRQLLQDVMSGN